MILTQCPVCAAELPPLSAKQCSRCKTRYCGPACQKTHWEAGGHDQLCKKIRRGGGAEQYHANTKYTRAVAVAAEACADDTKGQTCYICLEAVHPRTGEGLVRGCACGDRESVASGNTGIAHVSCLAEEAKILVAESEENHLDDSQWHRWHKCSLCEQHYHGLVSCALGWACWKTYLGRPETDWVRGMAMTHLGAGLFNAEHYEEALSVKEAVLSMQQRLGASENDILVSQTNLANTYHALGRLEQALQLERDVYYESLRLLGEEDDDTLISANNYANTLNELKRYQEARAVLRKTMPVARRVLGDSNEITLRMRRYDARALYGNEGATLDDLREAVTTLEDVERVARRVLGGAHPTTVAIEDELRDAGAVLRCRETPLRFKVGSRVKCCVDEGRWASGTVIKLWWWQGFYAPYQVELDEGRLVFAPEDSDRCIRREAATMEALTPGDA